MNDSRAPLRLRIIGLAGTALVFYLIFWVALAKVDISGLVPTTKMAREVIVFWRDLPFFKVEKYPAADGDGEVIYYTVPTQQVTHREMTLMMGTNAMVHPAPSSGTDTTGQKKTIPR